MSTHSSLPGGIFGEEPGQRSMQSGGRRFNPTQSSVAGGVFGGGAWAESAAQGRISNRDRKMPIGHTSNVDFMAQLAQAEQRDEQAQWQRQQEQQRRQIIAQERQTQVQQYQQQQQQHLQQRQQQQQQQWQQQQQQQLPSPPPQEGYAQQFARAQQQSQMQMQMREQHMLEQQQQQQQQQRHTPPKGQPKGILKKYSPPNGGPPAPPPPQQASNQAAGGFRRPPQDRALQMTDYTESRVLQAPGGDSSFSLTDGSSPEDVLQQQPRRRGVAGYSGHQPPPDSLPPKSRTPSPPRSAPSPNDMAAGYNASGLQNACSYHLSQNSNGMRRDPNRSSQPGGILFG